MGSVSLLPLGVCIPILLFSGFVAMRDACVGRLSLFVSIIKFGKKSSVVSVEARGRVSSTLWCPQFEGFLLLVSHICVECIYANEVGGCGLWVVHSIDRWSLSGQVVLW